MATSNSKDVSVAVIGGGLVGALQACVLAKKGYREVHLYEVRNITHTFYFISNFHTKINNWVEKIMMYFIHIQSIVKTSGIWYMLLERV